MNYFICSDNQSLSELQPAWRKNRVVGLDTEFIRTDTFYPIPALYQATHSEDAVLLDVLAIDDWQVFSDLLVDPAIMKVMHACAEDMEVFEVHLAVEPRSIFDTQLAHAFFSNRFSISYADLVEESVGIKLPKHATRSNWLRRPLSEEQLEYAAEDVAYLIPLYETLKERLQQTGRWEWFQEETSARPVTRGAAPELYYRGMRQARHMDNEQLALLRELTSWREHKARERNVPRGRIVRDEHLLRLAEAGSVVSEDLYEVLPHRVARRYEEDLLDASELAASKLHAERPEKLDAPLTQSQGELVKKLKAVGKQKAEELGIAEELLARKRDLEACTRYFLKTEELPEMYRGWRGDILGAEFRTLLQQYATRRLG